MLTRLVYNSTRRSAQDLIDLLRLDDSDPRRSLRSISDFFRKASGGWEGGSLSVNIGATKATATLTFTDNPTADETFTLCNIVFTVKASGASGNQWNLVSGGTAAADAAGNAAAVAVVVNANATLSKFITATSALGVVTFTCNVPGDLGNGLQLSESLTNATISGFVTVDAGDDGDLTTLSFL